MVLFLLAGFFHSINHHLIYVKDVQAATYLNTISKYNNTSCSTGFFNNTIFDFGTSNCQLKSLNNGSATITVKYLRGSATFHSILSGSLGLAKIYGVTGGNGAAFEFQISSGYQINSVTLAIGATNSGFRVNSGTFITSKNTNSTTNFASNTTKVTVKQGAASSNTDFYSFGFTYESLSETEAETYASDFLSSTENKSGQCDTVNLNWSTLETDYLAISTEAKTQLNSNENNQTIIDARLRYIYLRLFDDTLINFANI